MNIKKRNNHSDVDGLRIISGVLFPYFIRSYWRYTLYTVLLPEYVVCMTQCVSVNNPQISFMFSTELFVTMCNHKILIKNSKLILTALYTKSNKWQESFCLSVLSFSFNTLLRFASSLKHERSSWTKKSRIPFLCNFCFCCLIVRSFVRCGLVTQYYLCWIKQKTCPLNLTHHRHWTFTTTFLG